MKLPKLFVYVDTNMCDVFRNLGEIVGRILKAANLI